MYVAKCEGLKTKSVPQNCEVMDQKYFIVKINLDFF